MAANSPYFAAEDQTDEDFFDKLVDDDFVAQPEIPVRSFSSLSLNDAGAPPGDPELTSQAEDHGDKDVSFAQESILENEQAGGSTESTAQADSKGDGSKGTSVKVVQWSAFHVEPQQLDAGGFGFDSDFLTDNTDISTDKQKENAGATSYLLEQPGLGSSTFVDSSDQKDVQFYGSVSEQGSQDWENLYPGWKYDYTTGQWYQVDGYDTNAHATQSDGYAYGVGSGSATQSSVDKAHAPSDGFVSESSSMSYLQQTSHSVLGAIAEECTTASIANCNQDSQGSMQYPPNMLFDPQYPGWYYDTNTQQWYTLDSYTQSASQNAVTTLQDHFNRDANESADSTAQKSYSLYKEPSQFEQQTVQNEGHSFGGDWGVSTNNHAQRNWNASASNFAQQNVWQTEAVNESSHAADFHANQQSRSFYGSSGNIGSQMDQNIGFKPAEPVLSHGYAGNSALTRFQGFVHKETSSSGNTGSQMDQHVGFKPVESVLNHGHGSNSALTGFQAFAPKETSSAKNTGSQIDHHVGFKPTEPVLNHGYGSNGSLTGFQGFVPKETMYQFNQPKVEQNIQATLVDSSYGHHNSINYSQSMFQGGRASYSQFHHTSSEGRSSAGRPPHALVTFGFGGKVIIMKDDSSLGAKLDYGSQGTASGTVSILNLMDVVTNKSDGSSIISNDSCSYFDAVCQQSFPGPLVGGNTAAKDVNKWVDERIMNCEPSSMGFHKQELLKLLFSLLKISCQHYGKLRSPFGSDLRLEEIDGPEAAVTKLFASARKNGSQLGDYGSLTHCVKNLPSEGQIRATAVEVQNLLVSGRRNKALECAQDGHLWGPALVLAAQLGEKFYVETVKKMAQQQFISGSPLRTLCLLIAGQPADVFSTDSSTSSLASAANAYQQPAQVLNNGMLDDWEENLAIITANRTKDDELVIIHLGDCLWKERAEIIAAHICYLIAEANFESYSDSARLCLIGADHWNSPRTYASPEAIQLTELYEYSKVLGNPQFILLPFQPYKLIYASMLAEVGKVSDSLRYCQASLKSLKNYGRAPEVEVWKSLFSSLEERLRTHQQGGYGTNLAPAKLVGKFITSIDRSIHRMIGAPPPPLPPLPHDNANGKESYPTVPKVASSQSTMAMSSLIPSASVEAISEWTGDSNRKAMHNRSISEPDFGRSPKQASSKDSGSLDSQSKASISGGPSHFGRFGLQLLQKTMGWVSRSRPDHQAKLGERNKFYYDEKLKRWVEEGAELPAEEAALPPPPPTASFQNGTADYNINNAFKNQNDSVNGGPEKKNPSTSEQNSCTPPIPPSTNRFSARARMGVRSRYVDTFNKGGGSITNSFRSPSIPSVKPAVPANFFIPTAASASDEQPVDEPREHIQEPAPAGELSTSVASESLLTSSSTTSSTSIQRFPSMDNIIPLGNKKVGAISQNASGSLSSRTRAASWSGAYTTTALGDAMSGSSFVPHNPSQLKTSNSSLRLNGGLLGDDLHEVEL